jgi:tetratricopeptide (TPR) repeat protein
MSQPSTPNHRSAALETAWQRYAEFDSEAQAASKSHLLLRRWVIILAVVATLLAILTQSFSDQDPTLALILKIGLILTPLISTVLLNFANKIQQGERWLALRSGAEEILKEIYSYRTILQHQEGRDQWLNERVAAIQRQVFENVGGELVIKPFKGTLPPYYYPNDPDSDSGINDLLAQDYLRYRLDNQLNYHAKKIVQLQKLRTWLQVAIFVVGGIIGPALAALGGSLGLWVALTTSIAAAFTAWMELRRLDTTINNYSKVILELKIIRDHWLSFKPEQQTGDEFIKTVTATEKVLWSQHNQYITEMRQAVADLQGKDGDILSRVMNSPAPAALDEALLKEAQKAFMAAASKALGQIKGPDDILDAAKSIASEVLDEVADVAKEAYLPPADGAKKAGASPAKPTTLPAEPTKGVLTEAVDKAGPSRAAPTGKSLADLAAATESTPATAKPTAALDKLAAKEPPKAIATPTPPAQKPKPKKGLPHAFAVMPFGRKQGPDGRWIDFNAIYYDLIKPALEEAGFEAFRADEEAVSGDILTDMFQELLLADLVIADLSIDNANVFYELGVRHSLRKRGLVHIQSGRSYMPFDIFNVRTVPYHTDKNGRPDPEFLDKDKQAISKICRETWASAVDRVHSPIFNLLDGLEEPDRKALRTPLATGYWREHSEWEERVEIAQRQKRIGDVLLLTEEVTNPLIKEDVIAEAGRALRSLGRHELALQQYRQGLKLNPRNLHFRREEAFHLGRLKRYDEAVVKLERILQDNPDDIETISFLGRIYKDMWADEWIQLKDKEKRHQKAFNTSYWLKKAIDTYLAGYRLDQNHYYSGVNVLMLSILLDNLAQRHDAGDDPDIGIIRHQMSLLKGAVQFNLESQAQKNNSNFWIYVSLADMAMCLAKDPKAVSRAYQKALTLAGQNRFALRATLAQLELLESLDFRPEHVAAGAAILREEINKIEQETESKEKDGPQNQRHVFLFSGHMVDRVGRPEPRFPVAMEREAREKIEKALDKLGADANDTAIVPGAACGGDILFIESCLKYGMNIEVLLPFSDAEFIKESVSFAGDDWVARFYSIRNHPNVTFHYQVELVGPLPPADNAFERNNRWALYSALIYGISKVRVIALWDGKGGDGPGGTGHMIEEVRRLGGIAVHLDTTKFDYWHGRGKVNKALDALVQAT